tara:strand:- start:833 stop:1051 length:219 start_codon:yes stop_codon:yes gene_type:complete
MLKLTPAQHRVYRAIQMLSEQQGYVPSQAQVAAFLGVSRPVMNRHINAMCDRGVLRKTYGIPNSIEIIPLRR